MASNALLFTERNESCRSAEDDGLDLVCGNNRLWKEDRAKDEVFLFRCWGFRVCEVMRKLRVADVTRISTKQMVSVWETASERVFIFSFFFFNQDLIWCSFRYTVSFALENMFGKVKRGVGLFRKMFPTIIKKVQFILLVILIYSIQLAKACCV